MYIYSIYVDGELAVRGTAQQLAEMGLYCGKAKNVRVAYASYCRSVREGRNTVNQWTREGTPEKPGPKPQKEPGVKNPRKSVQEKKPEKGSGSINRMNRKGTTRREKQIARMRQESIGREQQAAQRERKNALRQAGYRKTHPERQPVNVDAPDAARNVARCHRPPETLRAGATALERDLWELDWINWERRQEGKPPKSYGFWRWEQDQARREAAALAAKRKKRREQEEENAAEEMPGQAV